MGRRGRAGTRGAPASARLALGATAAAALLTAAATPPTTPAGTRGFVDVVFVANAEDGTLSVIDARTHRVVRTIDVLPDGRNASLGEDDPVQATIGQRIVDLAGGQNYAQDQDISPDGRVLYVSRGHRGDVAAFELESGRMIWKTAISGLRADHMVISHDGRLLYVSALTEDVVDVVDAATGEVVASVPAGEWPHDNHLSEDGRRLFNGSIGNIITPWETRQARAEHGDPVLGHPYVLTVLDTETLEPVRTYEFDRGIRPFVLAEGDTRMYAQLSEFHGLIEFDLVDGRILTTLELPVDEGVTEDDYDFEAPHHGLAISPDEELLCAAARASDYVALVSVDTMLPVAMTEVGDAPSWAETSPDGRHCYVTNTRDGTVSILSYRTGQEVARVATGAGPKHLQPARVPTRALTGGSPGARATPEAARPTREGRALPTTGGGAAALAAVLLVAAAVAAKR